MIRAQMPVLKDAQELVQPRVTVVLELVWEVATALVMILVKVHVLPIVLEDVQKLVWDYVLLLVV